MVKNKIIAVALAAVMLFSSVDVVSCSAYRSDADIQFIETLAEAFLPVISYGAAVIGLSALSLALGAGILSCVDEEAYKQFKEQFKEFEEQFKNFFNKYVFRKETRWDKFTKGWRRSSSERKINKGVNGIKKGINDINKGINDFVDVFIK